MCGIVGALSSHEVAPLLVEALKRLEYRGYDSAGIATINHGVLDRRRAVGKLANLSDLLVHDPLPGKSGIGHTRWATHGAAKVGNAHPHRAGSVAVVHNGIVENFRDLREELIAAGIQPRTDTDTETVALMTEYLTTQGLGAVDATRAAVARLEGAFALCFLFEGEDDLLIAARRGSPLVIGHGEGETFVGSDAIALASVTDRVTYLEEGDFAILTRRNMEIRDVQDVPVERPTRRVRLDLAMPDKQGHKHFMAKEIAEQPMVLAEALRSYAMDSSTSLHERGLNFTDVDRMVMAGCGTAYLSCLTAKYWFERLARLPVEVDVASEFRYREPPVAPDTLSVFISQSGETADTLAALKYMRKQAQRIVAVVNQTESSIAREGDIVLPIQAGTEIGVASTKAFTSMLIVLAAMAVQAGLDKSVFGKDVATARLTALHTLPGLINRVFVDETAYARVGRKLAEANDILFLGRGAMFPIALEGALKLKEISYIHAEGYAAGELKHGPIALVDDQTPVVVMAPRDHLFDKTVSNMQEVMARGGKVLLITDVKGAAEAGDGVWETLILPQVDPMFAPILYAVPAQMLAYHTAVAKGTDVDQPRNLAKSVTVE